jgi:hypothetical protein
MATNSQGFYIPELPSIPSVNGMDTGANYDSIIKAIKSMGDVPSLTNSLVPQVQGILGDQGQFLAPQINAIRERGEGLAANAQSDATARGIRGSDIEAANMTGARLGALGEEGNLRGAFGMNQSNTLIDVLTKAMSGDLDAAKNLRAMLAQAMGQELGSQRDMEMFRIEQDNLSAAGDAANKAALWGAGIGAVGGLGGAGIRRSDVRLKTDIQKVGRADGLDIMSWKWNAEGKKLGLKGKAVGVLAQDLEKTFPQALGRGRDGFRTVNYALLPASVKSEIARLEK